MFLKFWDFLFFMKLFVDVYRYLMNIFVRWYCFINKIKNWVFWINKFINKILKNDCNVVVIIWDVKGLILIV